MVEGIVNRRLIGHSWFCKGETPFKFDRKVHKFTEVGYSDSIVLCRSYSPIPESLVASGIVERS